jgi:DNA-3-methyladenine glycosylase
MPPRRAPERAAGAPRGPAPVPAWPHAALFQRPAPELAPHLIGWELRAHGVAGRIVETEAYQGEEDAACHARRGCTPRTRPLYGPPGTLYLYLVYGMHVLLNLVCDQVGTPAAVLIRALQVTDGIAIARARRGAGGRRLSAAAAPGRLANGPGKVVEVLQLSLAATRTHLGDVDGPLQLSPPRSPVGPLRQGPRVGVAYAGADWAARPWRFWEEGAPIA